MATLVKKEDVDKMLIEVSSRFQEDSAMRAIAFAQWRLTKIKEVKTDRLVNADKIIDEIIEYCDANGLGSVDITDIIENAVAKKKSVK